MCLTKLFREISQLACITIRHTVPVVSARAGWHASVAPADTPKSCWLPLSPGAPQRNARRLNTLRVTRCPKAPLLHTAQTPAPQEAIPLGHEGGEGKTLGLGGMGKQEGMMFLSGIWKASAREFRCLQNHLLLTSKQTKVAQCPNYIC